jgi:cytochrome P450
MDWPKDVVAAVTHADPAPYYAELARRTPLEWDASLRAWVATGAPAVAAVLAHPACRVRPEAEPVPRALVGTPAGDVFAALVRMTDGAGHCPLKRAVSDALHALDLARVEAEARRWAPRLVARLSSHVLGALLGVEDMELDALAHDVTALVRAFAPAASPQEVERGAVAADALLHTLKTAHGPLGLQAAAEHFGTHVVLANTIGFLTQAHDATRGLVGNACLRLARDSGLRARVTAEPTQLAQVLDAVLHEDAPVQNTRRYVAEDVHLAGKDLKRGDTVLVVLAAANLDPAGRGALHTFGAGPHACPGERVARTMARVAVEHLLRAGLLPVSATYLPSVNARVAEVTR